MSTGQLVLERCAGCDVATYWEKDRPGPVRCFDCLSQTLTAQAREIERGREQVADLVNQFAMPGSVKGVANRNSGGLSDMESAFIFLGLPDPCPESEWHERLRAAAQGGTS